MSKKNAKFQKNKGLVNQFFGFTVVELLVVLSIMAILFSLGTINYRNFERQKRLQMAKNEFIATLRQAQEIAAAGVQPPPLSPPVDCGSLEGVRFQIDNTQDKYWYQADCGVGNPRRFRNYVTSQRLPDGVTINSSSGNFTFLTVGGGISTPSGNPVTITLTYPGLTNETIVIHPNGRIEP